MNRQYNKPPVVEAIIDFRVHGLTAISTEDLLTFCQAVEAEFPIREEMAQATATFQFSPQHGSSATAADNRLIGYRLWDHQRRRVLQATLHGLTYSHLPPYPGWNEICTEALNLLNLYGTKCRIEEIVRIGVRYINIISLPVAADIDVYLALGPNLPGALPNADKATGFFMQVQVPQPDINSNLVINQARATPPSPDEQSIVLDIDLFSEQKWRFTDTSVITQYLNQARNRKNDVFEACIADALRNIMVAQ